ncbi:LysR family transcriptional regulator [Methylococcus sp. Mc7]|uniref:LysR family transcriptional regulator n=1 Tax=Methylococcus sp. Mc7 TaxID=2860258 RepID=UPI001C52D885|nr:LysR family transcriptional regulator [Methylococcus sp. Mc7]QXP84473.1 LysR family transcriptional regulator [Methylococcus sp. Mc7]
MTAFPKITLDQWRTLIAVVEAGGYARAADQLHKSQSTLTYAVQKLERLLGVKVFEMQGRKAVLTAGGQVLYRRGKMLMEEALRLERVAAGLSAGWEPELRLAVDTIFPTWLLLECIARFAEEQPETRVELIESVLSGTDEALLEGRADLAIGSSMPPGFVGDPVMRVRFIAAAHPDHPLHRLGRSLTLEDLSQHRHLVVRDSGRERSRTPGWLNERRWTVTHKETSIRAACMGLGYAWYAEDIIRKELEAGELKPLPLREGAERWATLYLIFADRDAAGPGALRIAELVRAGIARHCPKRSAYQV